MNLHVRLTCLVLAVTFNLAKAQDYNNGNYYRGGHQGGSRNNPQQEKETPTESPKGYVSVNSGYTIPQGSFAFNVSSGYGNYAMSGSTENISAGIPINNSNFGIALLVGYAYHPFGINAYVNNISQRDTNSSRGGYQIVSGTPIYKETNLMAGVFYTYPWKRFSFDFRALVGVMFCSFPDITYQAVPYTIPPYAPYGYYNEQWETFASSSKTSVYNLGAGVRYSFRRNTCIMLNVDMLYANPTYSTNVQYLYYGNPSSFLPTSGSTTPIFGSMPISTLNITMGLGFQFGK